MNIPASSLKREPVIVGLWWYARSCLTNHMRDMQRIIKLVMEHIIHQNLHSRLQ